MCVGKRIGDFTVADGGAREAYEVEGMEEIHAPRIALVIHPRDQHQAENRDSIGEDDHDKRQPHPPQ
jgi:hypothetical protein